MRLHAQEKRICQVLACDITRKSNQTGALLTGVGIKEKIHFNFRSRRLTTLITPTRQSNQSKQTISFLTLSAHGMSLLNSLHSQTGQEVNYNSVW